MNSSHAMQPEPQPGPVGSPLSLVEGSPLPRPTFARRLPSLAAGPMYAVELAMAVASGITWTRCGIGHDSPTAACPSESLCVAAGVLALGIALTVAASAFVLWRRRAPISSHWSLIAVFLAVGFAGMNAQLLGFEQLGIHIGSTPGPIGASAAHVAGIAFGLLVAGVLARSIVRTARGRDAGSAGIALGIGIGGTVLGWAAWAAVTGTAVGSASVGWTANPLPTIGATLLAAAAAGTTLALRRQVPPAAVR